MLDIFTTRTEAAVSVFLVSGDDAFGQLDVLSQSHEKTATFAKSAGFSGEAGRLLYVPGDDGMLASVLYGTGDELDPFVVAGLSGALVGGDYVIENLAPDDGEAAAFAWALGAYSFDVFKGGGQKAPGSLARLVLPDGVDADHVSNLGRGATLTRDLVNTPASHMGPEELASAAQTLAAEFGADIEITIGDDLLKENLHMIHAVGRASSSAPRLIDMRWGDESNPKVTLVGKGVCFDSGGLNIKPGGSMLLMKKDMGGAANVLGLASMIMGAGLNLRLRVLIPAVENAIGSNAFRPGDVLGSRKGLSVEIGNTDAEGRLVLGDALALGDEEKPDLMIDMATLTGAARVALGPDLPPFYTDDEALAGEVLDAASAVHDPVWRMPLWKPYLQSLKSGIADINHISSDGFAGSVTAALFLQKFVDPGTSWAHFDIYAWNPKTKPGRKVGGADHAIRALFEVLSRRYG